MRYLLIVLLLTGCSSLDRKAINCLAMIQESRRAQCELQSVTQDAYLDKCSVVCK